MGAEYRMQVANLAQVLNREENRGEAADILRSLVDRIEGRTSRESWKSTSMAILPESSP
jgi:hypothetical protein